MSKTQRSIVEIGEVHVIVGKPKVLVLVMQQVVRGIILARARQVKAEVRSGQVS